MTTASSEETLTFREQLIKRHPVAPLAGVPGYVVLVFASEGGVEDFRFELREGDRAPASQFSWSSLFGEKPQYVAFAVSSDAQRRTEFVIDVKMDIALHEFKVNVGLVYRVADARRLVTRRQQDPLAVVQREAASLLRVQLARADWDRIRKHFTTVASEVVASVLVRLQSVALEYGLLVQETVLEPGVDREHYGDVVLIEEFKTTALKDEIEHDHNLRRDAREREREKAQHLGIIDGRGERIEAENVTHYSEMAAAAARAAIKAIENAATAIHTPAELAQAIATIRDAIEAMRNLNNGDRQAQAQLQAPPSVVGALPAPAPNSASAVIATMLQETEQMSWASAIVKQSLQSATLHLIAELLSPDATDVSVTACREHLSDARAAAALPLPQADYFGQYIDSDSLRKLLH